MSVLVEPLSKAEVVRQGRTTQALLLDKQFPNSIFKFHMNIIKVGPNTFSIKCVQFRIFIIRF